MKDIKGYEGLYAITSCGRVWSYRSKKFLSPYKMKSGYLQVTLANKGNKQKFLIHRLVAEAYLKNPNNYEEVSHLDETRDNNCVNNLAWVSRSENLNMPKYKERQSEAHKSNPKNCKQVRCIKTGIVYISAVEASRQTGISACNISSCCHKRIKTAGGSAWEFV